MKNLLLLAGAAWLLNEFLKPARKTTLYMDPLFIEGDPLAHMDPSPPAPRKATREQLGWS